VISGFALRNFVSIPAVLTEAARVLQPGGRLALLEVDTPSNRLLRWGHSLYFNRLVPLLGALLSDAWAYTYLPRSVSYLPTSVELQQMLEAAGFQEVVTRRLSGGIAQLVTAVKKGKTALSALCARHPYCRSPDSEGRAGPARADTHARHKCGTGRSASRACNKSRSGRARR